MSEAGQPGRRVVVFTKPARPGEVKTRLIGQIAPEAAAELHQAFLEDLLERLAGGRYELRIAWALAPGEPLPATPGGGFAQQGGDLGERLHHGLSAVVEGDDLVAAVGSDHPLLSPELVERAFAALEAGRDAVVGPARDGGYYLIGLRPAALTPRLFEGIPWSTAGVLEATLERCGALGLRVELLPMADDVDTPEDLRRLAEALAAEPDACPRTRSLLERWRRLEPA